MDSDSITHYFPKINTYQKDQFSQLNKLYSTWNEKINVISRQDIKNLYLHHVLHSLGISRIIEFKDGTQVLDLGTGGGFPGIPLAILFPQVHFHLIDSIKKKITVVHAVASALNLTNVEISQTHVDTIQKQYDFVVCRAVAKAKILYRWAHTKIHPQSKHALHNGLLCLKGGEIDEEMKHLRKPYSVYDLSSYFKESFFETKKILHIPIP